MLPPKKTPSKDKFAQTSASLCYVLLLALGGCNTPQQKAHNTPAPIPAPPQQTSQNDTSKDTSGQQSAKQQAATPESAGGEKMAATSQEKQIADAEKTNRANACEPREPEAVPDVEITDVPLDANGNPIEPESKTIAAKLEPEEECKTAKNSQEQQRQAEQQKTQTSSQQQAAAQNSAAGGVKTAAAQTGEEKLAAANANMDSRLAAFDELMRRAREAAEQERTTANSGGQYGGYGGQYDGQGSNQQPPDVRGEGGQADTSSGLGHTPDRSGETRPGEYKQVARGPVPADIPDGRDDDIVARQLREAASKETDPVLKEKLWEEYKKYKTGIVGR